MFNPENITPDDEAIVKGLVAQEEAEERRHFAHDFADSEEILRALIHVKSAWEVGQDYFPALFEDKGHERIFQSLKYFWAEHGTIPDVHTITLHLATLAKDVRATTRTAVSGVAETDATLLQQQGQWLALANYPMPQQTAEYWVNRMVKFLKQQRLRLCVGGIVDRAAKAKDNAADDAIAYATEELSKIARIGANGVGILDGAEFDRAADDERVNYVIEDWLENGSVNMLHGKSISGKTYLFTNACGAILEGGTFLNKPCTATPILYLNCDRNRLRRLRNNIKRGMTSPDRDEVFRQRMFVSVNSLLPATITAAHLDAYARQVAARLGGGRPIVIVIDTFRSAFLGQTEMGKENDASVMQFIKPIREWALTSGHCVVILHHNNKHADDYVGSGAFLMLLDSKWNYRRDEDDPVGRLTVTTRNDYSKTLEITLDERRLPVVLGECKGKDKKPLKQDPFVLENVTLSFGTGKSITDAYAGYNEAHPEMSKRSFYNLVEALEGMDKLVLVSPARGKVGAVYRQA